MKTRFVALCAFAAVSVFIGCQKENEANIASEMTHSLVFTAEKAGETRTAIASEGDGVVSYKWIAGDDERMHIYETTGEGDEKVVTEGTIDDMVLENDGKIATFHVTFAGNAPTGTITYSATYAGKLSGSKNALIPEEQSPTSTSFDPKADVLVAEPIVKTGREENPSFKFNMSRKVSVNKMTLKGLPEGKVISTVVFESDKYHSSYYNPSTGNYSSEGKKIVLSFTENNTVPSSGEFPVYFITAPVEDATFTVTATTSDNKRYVKSPTKKISFAVGQVRRFGLDLTDCEAPEGRVFTLVESVSDLVIGNDVIVAANGTKNVALSIKQNTSNRGETPATKSADGKTITITEQVQIFVLEQGTKDGSYAFHCSNGDNAGYIYAASSSSNHLKTQETLDDNASWKIEISDKEATITAQGTNTRNILKYNSSSSLFSCYASGQQTVYLYQAAGLPSPGMSWSADAASATISASGISFTAPSLTLGNASSVTYSSSVPAVATISDEGVVTIVAQGTTVISASFAGDNTYAPSTVSYTLTVTDTREKVAKPTFNPAAGAVAEGTTVTISSTTEGATIYYTVDGTTPTTASTQGTTVTINEAKTIKAIAIKDGYFDSDVATAEYTIIPPATTIATILADNTITSSNTKNYSVAGVTVMAAQGKNYVIGDATGVMLMFSNVSPALVVGNQYDVQGDVKLYNGVHEFNGPTVQSSTGTAPAYGTPEEMTVSSLTAYASAPVTKYAKVYVTAPASGYVCSDGTNSVNVYDGTGTFAQYYGKPIIVTGYLIGYYSGKINIIATAIEQDVVSYLSVSPEALLWAAGEFGSSVAKTITVSIDDTASGYTVSGGNDDWTVSDNENGTITVYPNTANTSSEEDKTLTLTISHDDDASISKPVTCTQSKVVSGTTEEITGTFTLADNALTLTSSSGVTIQQIKVSGSTNVNGSYNTTSTLRVYKGHALSFSGKTFKRIEITVNGTYYGNGLTVNDGSLTPTTTSGGTIVWEGNSDSVTITNVASESNVQLRTQKIVVTY